MTTPEKRQFRRVPMVAKIQAESGGKPCIVEARNISLGGMLIRTAMTIHEKQTLTLRFTLPGGDQEITVSGVAQHVSPEAFIGVRFEALSPETLAAIEKYVNENPS